VVDPEGLGRVQVHFPADARKSGTWHLTWARLATLMAGNQRGTWFIPDVGDEVLVACEGGDPTRPYVVGALWNQAAPPPAVMDAAGTNDRKILCSRSGIQVTLDDGAGREAFVVETPGGQRLRLTDAADAVELADSNGNALRLHPAGITIVTAGKLTVDAAQVSLRAGEVGVETGMAKFSGVVKTDTLIANSVVGSSYTPGAGNVL
jgi:uncharacterized protein involved in type VI secretion and phage assembly